MKRLITIAVVLCTVAFAAPAYADVDQSWIDQSVAAAQSYWGNTIPQNGGCTAIPTIVQVDLASQHGGFAYFGQCLIQIDGSESWLPYQLCIAVVHEWGHLTLGATFFATENPADPTHSVETTGQYAIMQENSDIYSLQIPQCQTMARAIDPPTVVDPPPTKSGSGTSTNIQLHDTHHKRRRHKRHHHRRAHH